MEPRLPVLGTVAALRPVHRRRRRLVKVLTAGVAVVLVASVAEAAIPGLATRPAAARGVPAPSVPAPDAVTAALGLTLPSLPPRAADPFGEVPGRSFGATPPTATIPLGPPARVVYRVRTTQKVVALTFDDGWSPAAGRLILATLLRLKVPATFFVNSMYLHRDPQLWKDIAAAGFPVGNHTYDHRNLTTLTPEKMLADIQRDASVFHRVTGYEMAPIFRPPYGARNRTVDAMALAAGFPTEVLWNTVAGDTGEVANDARMIANASAGGPGSIVLMHVGPAATPRVLAAIIARYQARGFSFVTIPQLLALG